MISKLEKSHNLNRDLQKTRDNLNPKPNLNKTSSKKPSQLPVNKPSYEQFNTYEDNDCSCCSSNES